MRLSRAAIGPLGALLLVPACAGPQRGAERAPAPAPMVMVEEPPEWAGLASAADRDRLARLDGAWSAALAEARARGFGRAIDGEEELLVPQGALAAPSPPPGSYRCRVIKIGSRDGSGPSYAAYKPFFCYVEAEGSRLNITKQTGSQRPAGWLYKDDREDRLVFLGTLALGDEKEPLPYGQDAGRDMAGVVERVAPYRYRLVVPWPRQESKLDVIELVPAPQER